MGAAFPTLSETQISFLKDYGVVRETKAGQVLFQEGDTSYDFIVILEGTSRSWRTSAAKTAR